METVGMYSNQSRTVDGSGELNNQNGNYTLYN